MQGRAYKDPAAKLKECPRPVNFIAGSVRVCGELLNARSTGGATGLLFLPVVPVWKGWPGVLDPLVF